MLRKSLWDLRWVTFWYGVGGAGYTLLVSLFFPTIQQQSTTFAKLVATYPKGILTALGWSNITTFTGFISAEALNLFWPIIVGVFATLAGAALVAKEVEDGTSEIWLSSPVQRWRLLLGKMAALGIGLLFTVVACLAAVEISSLLDSAPLKLNGLLAAGVTMIAFLFAVAGYSGLFSAFVSSRGAAAGISFGLTLVFYALWVVGGLSDRWMTLKHLSIFSAYAPQKALETGAVDPVATAVLLVTAASTALMALIIFQRRDAI